MPDFTADQGSRLGVPIAYNFTYGGVAVDWGTKKLMEMGDVSCHAEPFDGKFTVSELRTSFSDTDGSIWGSLGHGTIGIGSSWEATCYVGGVMVPTTYGPTATRIQRTTLNNSGTYVIHTGRIEEVSRKNRMVEIVSRDRMGQIEDLEWVFPIGTQAGFDAGGGAPWDSMIGTNFFFNAHVMKDYATNYAEAYFNVSDDRTAFDVVMLVGSYGVAPADYPPAAGRGTPSVAANFTYVNSDFLLESDKYLFKGTFFGTLIGSIESENEAQAYGYADLQTAEAAKLGGSRYNIYKTRLAIESEGNPEFRWGSAFFLQQAGITLEGSPAELWQTMLTGACVTDLFGSSTIDSVTFATALRNTAFQSHSQTIDPRGGKVLPDIKNLLEPLRAMWSIGSDNKFKLFTFGPKTYADILGTVGSMEVISSETSSSLKDRINRLTFKYGYNFQTGSYSKRIEARGTPWGSNVDAPLVIESKWLSNDNDANIVVSRLLKRFQLGVPRASLTVPLSRLNLDVGSLIAVDDQDCWPNTKPFEVIGWSKSFSDSRSINLSLFDGDALYKQQGYAKWEGDANLEVAVSGTSQSGWSDHTLVPPVAGTVNSINEAFYGSVFHWF